MLGPYVGWGVRAGCRVDLLGWACLDDACTLLWVSFGVACSRGYEMSFDCFLLGGRVWSECRFFPQRWVGSESGKSSGCAWMGLLG
ncbi:hypothetical protein Csa_021697 [Cucumis sativus]|nr:hypothetical protein CSA_015443 [Cucumis sativus]KAE8652004.1 hypothetical protein Csa_021697 [Cucumis sativus]